jgi:hypothetical protein
MSSTLTTQTSAPSKKPVVPSKMAPMRVETQPPMKRASSSDTAAQTPAPVPSAPASVSPG